MINTCKFLRVIAIRTYWAEQLIFLSKMIISAQYVRIVRIGHSYVLGSNIRRPDFYWFSLRFHLKFPIKNNRTLPTTKLNKQGIL